MFYQARKNHSGFTLIELLVVLSIIAILAAVIGVNALASNQKSRDAKRQADLRNLQTAIELYKQKNGRYPAGCPTAAAADGWSGQLGTIYECTDGSTQYIAALAPEFIPVLPFDKKLNGTNSGYVYRTNADGSVYKIMAMRTVESERLNTEAAYAHPMKSCDMRVQVNPDGSFLVLNIAWCMRAARDIGNGGTNRVVPWCQYSDERFQTSYGLWGGFAPCTGGCAGQTSSEAWSEVIICK